MFFLFSCLLNGKLFSNFERTKYLDKQCVNTKTHFLHVTNILWPRVAIDIAETDGKAI